MFGARPNQILKEIWRNRTNNLGRQSKCGQRPETKPQPSPILATEFRTSPAGSSTVATEKQASRARGQTLSVTVCYTTDCKPFMFRLQSRRKGGLTFHHYQNMYRAGDAYSSACPSLEEFERATRVSAARTLLSSRPEPDSGGLAAWSFGTPVTAVSRAQALGVSESECLKQMLRRVLK